MSNKKSSKMWSIALMLSVVFLAAAYYIKVPEFRKFVDSKTPVAHEYLGRFVQEPVVKIEWKGEMDPLLAKPTPARSENAAMAPMRKAPETPAPAPVIAKVPDAPVLPAAPSPGPNDVAPDLAKIAGNRALWPKKVTLTKDATFPAVLNGKIVGSLVAPAGSEAILHSIKDDKVGLEFNGGGAWLPAGDTDLLARAAQAPQ